MNNDNEIRESSYYFNFYDADKNCIFHSKMLSGRCEFIKTNQERCKKRCVIGIQYCRSHIKQATHLEIKKSTIPEAGLGLFTTVDIKKGQKIINYEGEHLTEEEVNERYQHLTAPYTAQLSKNEYIDSALQRSIGAIANTGIQKVNCNCELVSDYKNHRIIIKTIKNIQAGEELKLYYGRLYRMDEGSSYNVKKK